MTNNDSIHCTLLASVKHGWLFHFMGNLQPVLLRVNSQFYSSIEIFSCCGCIFVI